MKERLSYRPEEFSNLTGLSLTQVYRMIGEGTLPSVKIGPHATLLMVKDMNEFLESRRVDVRPRNHRLHKVGE